MELLSNLNGTAKMVLKVRFRGEFSVRIDLVSINKEYIKKSGTNDFMYYKNNTYDFVLWSTQDFIFDDRQLRLPDEKNITDFMYHTHLFVSDKERYSVLKKIYNTLEDWSKNDDINKGRFMGDRKRIVFAGDYWFVS